MYIQLGYHTQSVELKA